MTATHHPAFIVAHAYTPRETGGYGGSNHITTRGTLDIGRLHRNTGDALCKPREKFWGLSDCPERPLGSAGCKRCRAIALRLGIIAAKNSTR